MARETWVQSQVESYQRLKKWYLMPPCLRLSIIRYGSRVKWSNPGKGVAPSPTLWCSKLSKREPSGHPRLWSPFYFLHVCMWIYAYIYLYLRVCVYMYMCVCVCVTIYTYICVCGSESIHIYIYIYCHPQTDCFVVSQLFGVARHVGHWKLGSKPAQRYASIIPLSQ